MDDALAPILNDVRWPNSYVVWANGNFLWNLSSLAIYNTYLAMTSSVVVTFLMTSIVGFGKFSSFIIQNASLAGGITIAACGDMFVFPIAPLLIGAWSAIVTVLAMKYLTPLYEMIGFYDTRSAFNLHGINSIFGMAASAIACSTLENTYFGPNGTNLRNSMLFGRSAQYQAGMQVAGWAVAIGIGYVGGIVVGFILRIWRSCGVPEDTFGDHIWWKMVQDENRPKAVLDNSVIPQTNQPVSQIQMTSLIQPTSMAFGIQ